MKTVISNRNWFKSYLLIRNSILLLAAFWLIVQIWPPDDSVLLQIISSVAISLLLVMILFDTIQKPGLFEILRHEEGLLIKMFHPDTRYFIWPREQHIRSFTLQQNDQLQVLGEYKGVPWKKKIHLVIQQANGQKYISNKIDISWARKSELQQLLALVEEFKG